MGCWFALAWGLCAGVTWVSAVVGHERAGRAWWDTVPGMLLLALQRPQGCLQRLPAAVQSSLF